MGSLSSKPRIPASQPQAVFIQQAPVAQIQTEGTPDIEQAQSKSEARESNLLRRNRGRFGTIQTGFRGLLSLANSGNQRRTLLGE